MLLNSTKLPSDKLTITLVCFHNDVMRRFTSDGTTTSRGIILHTEHGLNAHTRHNAMGLHGRAESSDNETATMIHNDHENHAKESAFDRDDGPVGKRMFPSSDAMFLLSLCLL